MGNIEMARDIVICVSGIAVSVAVVIITILAYSLYKRAKAVLNTLDTASSTVYQMSVTVKEEVVEPLLRFAALVRGIAGGIDFVSKFFQRREGSGNV